MRKHDFYSVISEMNICSSCEGLSAAEETELSKRILAGEEAKKTLAGQENLSEEERLSLQKTVDDGEQAYDRLVLANVPRASKIAAETIRKNPNGFNDYDDYQQTALKVICICARTYDWRAGCRFSTYVHQSLLHEMLRENARTRYALRIPEEKMSQISTLKKAIETDGLIEAANMLGITNAEAEKMLLASNISKSLQSPVSAEDSDTELGDMISDPAAMTAEEIEAQIDLKDSIEKLMTAFSVLPDEEKILLRGRMGFDGEPLPMKTFVGTIAKSISSVQKKQIAAEKHLREIFFSLPMAG